MRHRTTGRFSAGYNIIFAASRLSILIAAAMPSRRFYLQRRRARPITRACCCRHAVAADRHFALRADIADAFIELNICFLSGVSAARAAMPGTHLFPLRRAERMRRSRKFAAATAPRTPPAAHFAR